MEARSLHVFANDLAKGNASLLLIDVMRLVQIVEVNVLKIKLIFCSYFNKDKVENLSCSI